MTSAHTHIRFLGTAAALLLGAAACGRSKPTTGSALEQDLAAAGKTNSALVVSPLELAPEGAKPQAAPSPRPSAPKAGPRTPAHKAPTRVARVETPAPTPTPAPEPSAPTTVDAAPSPAAPVTPAAQAPLPMPTAAPAQAPAQQPHTGPYKTEAEIFKQMPWIRP
jgi:hypothetical protein